MGPHIVSRDDNRWTKTLTARTGKRRRRRWRRRRHKCRWWDDITAYVDTAWAHRNLFIIVAVHRGRTPQS